MYRLLYYFFMGEFPCKHVYENYKLISIDAKKYYKASFQYEYLFSIKIIGVCSLCKEKHSLEFHTTAVNDEYALKRDKNFNLAILKKYITSEYGVDFDGVDVYAEP